MVDGRRIKTLPAVFKMGSVLDLLHNLLTACFKTYFAVMQVISLATSCIVNLIGRVTTYEPDTADLEYQSVGRWP